MFNQSNSSFQIWWILSQVWLNSAKEWVSFISNSYIKIAWTLTSAIFPKNFLFQTCEGWWLRFLAALLLVHLGMSCTFDYSCSFQTPPLAPQWTLQPCLLKSTFAEISRCGSEFLPATRVPQRFAGWRCLTGHWVHSNFPRFLNHLFLSYSRSSSLWPARWSPINWIIGHFPLLCLASAFFK